MIQKIKAYIKSRIIFYIKNIVQTILLEEYLVYGGDRTRLKLSSTAIVNNALFNVVSGEIVVKDHVFFGHNVCVLTGSHDYKKFNEERKTTTPHGQNIVIEEGVWIASNVTILAPCIIGKHAVVAAGSLVRNDVLAYSIVAGVPAKVIRKIQ
jgi:acetyltransferase-like isoleucine patch superfamily enzyme